MIVDDVPALVERALAAGTFSRFSNLLLERLLTIRMTMQRVEIGEAARRLHCGDDRVAHRNS
jgi:hypothetical protein